MAKRKREEPEPEDDRPWTEAQWEAFMKRSDLRSARFGELLETLIDDPDRDAKIDHEMGWEKAEDDDHDFAVEMPDLDETERAEIEEQIEEEDRQLELIPGYAMACELGHRCGELLKPLMSDELKSEEVAEAVGSAFIGSHIAGAKIAGGHGMGYADDVLCGNIVNNRRALEGAKQGLSGWQAIREMGLLPPAVADPIIAQHVKLQQLIEERIVELRKRVWW